MADEKFGELAEVISQKTARLVLEALEPLLAEIKMISGSNLAQQGEIVNLLKEKGAPAGRAPKVGSSSSKTGGKKSGGKKSGVAANARGHIANLCEQSKGADPAGAEDICAAVRAKLGVASWDDYEPISAITDERKRNREIGYLVWKTADKEDQNKLRALRTNAVEAAERADNAPELGADATTAATTSTAAAGDA